MILKIFLAALLLEIASVPIALFAASWIITMWYSSKEKHVAKMITAAGEELTKMTANAKEGKKE